MDDRSHGWKYAVGLMNSPSALQHLSPCTGDQSAEDMCHDCSAKQPGEEIKTRSEV